ncbi:MAG: hypothetical protein MZV64_68600 [Ignavibacteriales bacterium]|nr:hypothetical protein [Ignavibacteriales bacterium]
MEKVDFARHCYCQVTGRRKNYEEMDYKWQDERRALNTKVAELKRNRAPKQEILDTEEEYNLKRSATRWTSLTCFVQRTKNYRKIGAFEGASDIRQKDYTDQ